MKRHLIYSFLLHFLIFLLIYLGLPNFTNLLPKERIITVELLPIAAKTNVQPKRHISDSHDKKDNNKNKTVPKSAPEPIKKPIEKAQSKKIEVKKTVKKQPDQKKDVVVQKKEEKTKEKIKVRNQAQNNNVSKAKIQPKKTLNNKVKNHEIDSLLKTLEKTGEKEDKKNKNNQANKAAKQNISAKSDNFNEDAPLTLSEQDYIRNQISKCWTIPSGAMDIKNAYIILRISLNPDGSVTNVGLVEAKGYNKNSDFYSAVVDSAMRAVKMCSPIENLPVAKYNSWKELELNFDPSSMIY